MATAIAKSALMRLLRSDFRLDWQGIHGSPHWSRVRLNGLALAKTNGAREDVVELFALLHDSQRLHDGHDRQHGTRAADFVARLHGQFFALDPIGLDMLVYACRYHSDGLLEADITIQTCWDADRLDLARVGVRPDVSRLCTAAARETDFVERAVRRSLASAPEALSFRWQDSQA